jgi:hypothetical protein
MMRKKDIGMLVGASIVNAGRKLGHIVGSRRVKTRPLGLEAPEALPARGDGCRPCDARVADSSHR